MREQTFTGGQLSAALARVRRELGPDAVIVSSRRIAPGTNGASGPTFEVRAAAGPSRTPTGRGPCLLARLLARNGVAPELIERLLENAPEEAKTLRQATETLTDALRATVRFGVPNLGKSRAVLAVAGPTGAGKTTTLAKLAAEVALVQRRKAAIITLDGYRIGATAQIEQFADLIGIPLAVARDARGFQRTLRRLADAEVIFVDTPGRSPRDKASLIGLADILHSTDVEVDVTLCIPAATRTSEIGPILETHAVLASTSLTMTKLDEASCHDSIAVAQIASALPLAWFTTGQRVPEDIEEARPERLAAALCGEEA